MRKVYLISALNKESIIDDEIIYKIGITKQEKNKRIKQLQTGTDKKLEIVKEFYSYFPFKLEKTLHNYFVTKRLNREWFKLTNEDVNNFIKLCEKYENNFNKLKINNNPFI